MSQAHLFRLGMDLETGATHEEETTGTRAIRAVAAGASSVTQPAPTDTTAPGGGVPLGAAALVASPCVQCHGVSALAPLPLSHPHAAAVPHVASGTEPYGMSIAAPLPGASAMVPLEGEPPHGAALRDPAATDALLDPARHDHFIRRGGKVYAGVHLIIEVIDGRGLDDEARVQAAFRDCITASGATLLHIHTHKFSPQGVSGVAVLSESHISVHTWPEIGYGAFDVFMCGDADPWASVPVLKRAFQAREVRVQEFLRGEGLVG